MAKNNSTDTIGWVPTREDIDQCMREVAKDLCDEIFPETVAGETKMKITVHDYLHSGDKAREHEKPEEAIVSLLGIGDTWNEALQDIIDEVAVTAELNEDDGFKVECMVEAHMVDARADLHTLQGMDEESQDWHYVAVDIFAEEEMS